MKLPIYTTEGKDSGNEAELADSIFGIEPNETVIYEAVRRYMANQRQGTSNTKERGQVRGGGRKAYRQKGTGRARRGSIRSPLLKGGGTVFGPSPRNHGFRMSKKSKELARKSALSAKKNDEALKIIDDFSFDEPKTRKVADILEALEIEDSKVLLLTAGVDEIVYKSARNIPNIEVLEANKPSTYQILDTEVILIQESALEILEESIETAEEKVA
ncbi:LSU ribosomal protein L4P [Fodinibius salinus]|uniref:Large ribosomal subunit protein uL4 n=1 Tax=Fodinibius salinus TaxID=860790 RepID=A0A5D3YEU3_9BACT|nr:50S ribosomal protein L4 [Fodinibius salinus]TYP91450.1 LSU ribosomal protein L4P [Fodinibius salinus]